MIIKYPTQYTNKLCAYWNLEYMSFPCSARHIITLSPSEKLLTSAGLRLVVLECRKALSCQNAVTLFLHGVMVDRIPLGQLAGVTPCHECVLQHGVPLLVPQKNLAPLLTRHLTMQEQEVSFVWCISIKRLHHKFRHHQDLLWMPTGEGTPSCNSGHPCWSQNANMEWTCKCLSSSAASPPGGISSLKPCFWTPVSIEYDQQHNNGQLAWMEKENKPLL